jgi:myo-inositol-1(or 4)-monophosphatase
MAGDGRVTVSLRRSTGGGLGTPAGAGAEEVATIGAHGTVAVMPASPAPAPDPDALVALAVDLAGQSVRLLLDGVGRAKATVETKSSATDMVSEMDRASEHLIVSGLLAERPGDGIVGEEGSSTDGVTGLRWVIDPLDGTTNYLYGHPGWAVSIAAVHGEVVTATRGGGARRNGEPISCSAADDVATALVGTGFGYDPERRRAQGEVIAGLLPRVRDIRRMGAAAVDLCSVGCGRLDAYYERGLAWWDLAAGALVATEAGAVVSSLDGGPMVPGSVLAAAPRLAAPLREALCSLGAQNVP